jgi:hypothetical protein
VKAGFESALRAPIPLSPMAPFFTILVVRQWHSLPRFPRDTAKPGVGQTPPGCIAVSVTIQFDAIGAKL